MRGKFPVGFEHLAGGIGREGWSCWLRPDGSHATVFYKGSHENLSIDTHTSGSTVVLHSRAIADCGHVDDGLSGEAPERGTRRGLLVYRAWLVGSQLPWGT